MILHTSTWHTHQEAQLHPAKQKLGMLDEFGRKLDSLEQLNINLGLIIFHDTVHGHREPPVEADVLDIGDLHLVHVSKKSIHSVDVLLWTGLLGGHALFASGRSYVFKVGFQITNFLCLDVHVKVAK